MATRRRPDSEDTDIQRILGQLLEAHRHSDEERKEAKEERAEMKTSIETLANAVRGLDQTVQSSSKELLKIDAQRIDDRLTRQEQITLDVPKMLEDLRFYRRMIGAGWGFISRVVGLLAAVAALAAAVAHFSR